jgi:hypothetical protein
MVVVANLFETYAAKAYVYILIPFINSQNLRTTGVSAHTFCHRSVIHSV